MPIYRYPLEESSPSELRPMIKFECVKDFLAPDGFESSVYFPMPNGVTFSENAIYQNIELGTIGGALISNDFNIGATAKNVVGSFSAEQNRTKAILQGLRALQLPGSDSTAAKAFAIQSKTAINPNINTAFQNNDIRTFQFDFKMVGRTEKQTKMIRDIVRMFRVNTYASATSTTDSVFLQYPSTWQISFVFPEDNKFYPKIFESYLTSTIVTFNEGSNIHYRNGSPVETKIQLTFRETKALKANEIASEVADIVEPVPPPPIVDEANNVIDGGADAE